MGAGRLLPQRNAARRTQADAHSRLADPSPTPFVPPRTEEERRAMDPWREVQKAMAAHRLAWQDIWKVTVDRQAREVILIATDGRKFRHPLGAPPAAPPQRVRLVK